MRQRTRLIINVITNYGAFTIYGVTNFILVGYVIRCLGKDAFGIVSLVLSLTIVTEFLGRGVCQALTKYVAAETSSCDFDKANRYISTSLLWLGGCGLVGAAICGVLAVYIDKLFNIPPLLLPEARLAVLLMGLRVLVCFPFNTFQSILWAHQRYDLTNIAKSITNILRLLLVIAYFKFISAGIVELMVITIITLVIERIMWVAFSLRIAGDLRFGISFLSAKAFTTLLGFGGYILIIFVANMIGYEAVKWVVGFELPVMVVGAYSLIATIAMTAGSMMRPIANVLMPVASQYDALKRHDLNARLASIGTKYVMIVAGVTCLVPLFLLKPFLILWIGDAYSAEYMSQLAIGGAVLLVGQWFIAMAVCILQMLTGVGKVSFPAKVTMSWAVAELACIWAYLHWGSGTLLGVVVIITVARTLGSIIHLVYGIHVLGLHPSNFLVRSILQPASVGVIVCVCGLLLNSWFDLYKIPVFVVVGIILLSLYGVASWIVTLTGEERAAALSRMLLVARKLRP